MGLIRIIYRPSGKISITEITSVVDAQCKNLKANHPRFKNCTWEDIDESLLPPDRTKRSKWRKDPSGSGVIIDNTVITKAEQIAIDEATKQAEIDDVKNRLLILEKVK